MDLSGLSKPQLVDQLITLAANLKEDDLKDPATYGMVVQLLNILDPSPEPLPQDMIEKLQTIADPKSRFVEAAMALNATSLEQLGRLVDSMKAAGLMKAEELDEALAELTKATPYDISKSHILLFPVTINGESRGPNDASDYHATLKWMGNREEEQDHRKIQDIVDRHKLSPPKDFEIEPDVWHGQQGDVHVLKLKGKNKGLEYAHHELSEDRPSLHPFVPHITVSKELHDRVKNEGLKAKDLNIEIKPLEYRVGHETKRTYIPAPKANEAVYASGSKIKKSGDFMDAYEKLLKKIAEFQERLEKSTEGLDKGVDEHGNGIRGRNKRYQQAKVFGKPSDVKTEVKADGAKVHSYKIPDANGARVSPQRMKMMNTIKDYAQKKMGVEMTVAEGKRDDSGKLKTKVGIDKQPFDVFTPKGHKEEKARQAKIDAKNAKLKPGQKPMKRVDPKPDHRSGKLETQPSPDAAIHEIAHEALAPKGMDMAAHQTHMDKLWGESQSKYGHMQQKKTAGEVQPMAAENPIRREMGLPANRTAQKVKDASKPVEQTVDGTGPRFNRGQDSKGRPQDYMRQSRLLSPENKERIESLRDGRLKYTKDGIQEGTSVDAKINARAAAKQSAPKANAAVKPEAKPANHINSKKPEKLAASEIARDGKSFRQMKESDDSKE